MVVSGRGGDAVTIKHSSRELWGVMALFCILIVAVVIQMYITELYQHPQRPFLPTTINTELHAPTELNSCDAGGKILQL